MVMPRNTSDNDDPDGGARQPGSGGGEPAAAEWLLPPSLTAILQSSSGGEDEAAILRRPSCELRCLVSLAKMYLHNAPAPERETTPLTRALCPRPEVIIKQSMRSARGALEHYNRRNKIELELVDVMPISMMCESSHSYTYYTHVNFTAARSGDDGSPEQLFFAELQLCSRRQAPAGFIVTCCEPLGSDATVGHKGLQLDGTGTSAVRKNMDFTYCFGCSPRMLHPRGDKYIAGHCNVPNIYQAL